MASSPTSIRVPALTENQRRMIASPARVLWVGCGTKTGKTTAFALWIAEGILKGERCAWIGPWHQRTRTGFEAVKAFLSVPIERGDATASESTCRIRTSGGGKLDAYSGDNPESVYGDAYHRVVIDEASRQTEKSLTAALTTISATGGKVRLAFNLDRGRKNWAIAGLLRVRALGPEERKARGEDCMTFATLGEGFVSAETIEAMHGSMPLQTFAALYEAQIPESDVALFRNLDAVFTGLELDAPAADGSYVAGIDLARKRDWTVITIIDVKTGRVVAHDRFNQISWTLQVEKCAALYQRFKCRKAWVDASGVGDPIVEEFRKRQMDVEPFIFTSASKKSLLESLVLACDKVTISIPPSFATYRAELESMEYQLDGGEVRYGVASGMTDDAVMSLALAVKAVEGAAASGPLVIISAGAESRSAQLQRWY